MLTKSLLLPAVRLRGGRTHSTTSMAASPLWTSAKVFAACNGVGLGISLAKDTHTHLDLIGTGAFAVAAYSVRGPTAASQTSAMMVGAWATRLASFLFYRALGHRDGRLEGTTKTLSGCVGFWFVSFLWGSVVFLPHALGAGVTKEAGGKVLRRSGLALFGLGLATEVLADFQKYSFKRNHKGFCDVGLWAVSQHPNWFGNLCLWSGVFLYNAPGLSLPRLGLAALSPVFLGALFGAQASGALTPAVELAQARYGSDPRFASYLASTPLFMPRLEKWLGALARGLVGQAPELKQAFRLIM